MKNNKKILFFISILIIVILFLYGTYSIEVKRLDLSNTRFKDILKEVKIIQISDLHIKRIGILEKILIKYIERLDPDIILITGDLVGSNKGIIPCSELLGRVSDKRKVIVILGNNDHPDEDNFIDTQLLIEELSKVGVIVLINESLYVSYISPKDNQIKEFYIIGLDDNFSLRDDIFQAMLGLKEKDLKILLSHTPHIIEKIATKGIDLILSGHTHGGQLALPLLGAFYTNMNSFDRERYVSGLYKKDTFLYVNRGIGTVAVPFRIFSRPEITLLQSD